MLKRLGLIEDEVYI